MTVFGRLKKLFPKSEDKFEDDVEVKDDVVILKNTDEPEADAFGISQLSWGLDFEIRAKSIYDLITMYRRATINFEVDDAIDEIVNEAIIKETDDVVDIDLDKVDLSDSIKKKIKTEFDEILKLLNFNNESEYLFRKWYTDGRLYFQDVVDNEKEGIKKIQLLSPFDIIRIKIDNKLKEFAAEKKIELKGEYAYVYKINQRRLDGCANTKNLYQYNYKEEESGYLISDALITFVPSGLTDYTGRIFISPLHKCLKPLNQLRLLEDSAVIYRITRAPERRVFFIDVGKLPKKKADAYVQKLIRGFKSKVYYDANTGQLSTKRNVLSMIQDYYLPTNSDQKGTKIETLEGGQQLGEIDDIIYFKKKLYKSLKVPVERIDDDENPSIQIGRSGEMPRKELKFVKYIKNLRYRFSFLFMDLLEKQLVYKSTMSKKDWMKIRNDIKFLWQNDSYYAELKDTEIMKDRLETATEIEEFIGKYFSNLYVQKEIFKMTDDDIKEQQDQIKKEEDAGEIDPTPEDEFGDGSPEPKDDKDKQQPEPEEEEEPEEEPKETPPKEKEKPPKEKE
jgi:hypothetical protein